MLWGHGFSLLRHASGGARLQPFERCFGWGMRSAVERCFGWGMRSAFERCGWSTASAVRLRTTHIGALAPEVHAPAIVNRVIRSAAFNELRRNESRALSPQVQHCCPALLRLSRREQTRTSRQ